MAIRLITIIFPDAMQDILDAGYLKHLTNLTKEDDLVKMGVMYSLLKCLIEMGRNCEKPKQYVKELLT